MSEKRHYADLDGLRAMAIIGVMWFHLTPVAWHYGVRWENGIYLFFVLSGYLINGILMKGRLEEGKPRWEQWKAFVARRSLRILPAYYVALLLGLAVLSPPVLKYFWAYVLHGSNFVTIWIKEWPPGVSVFWTLAVEMQYYLCCSVVMILAPRKAWLPIILAGILAATVWREMSREYSFTQLYPWAMLDFFGMGALLAWCQRCWKLPARWVCHVTMWSGLLIYEGTIHQWFPGYTGQILSVLTMLGFAGFSTGMVGLGIHGIRGPVGGFLRMNWVQWTGKVSYGLYLYHSFSPYASAGVIKLFGGERVDYPFIALLIEVPVVLLITWLSFRFIEMPANRLKERF